VEAVELETEGESDLALPDAAEVEELLPPQEVKLREIALAKRTENTRFVFIIRHSFHSFHDSNKSEKPEANTGSRTAMWHPLRVNNRRKEGWAQRSTRPHGQPGSATFVHIENCFAKEFRRYSAFQSTPFSLPILSLGL
jgi:hypothetical protein